MEYDYFYSVDTDVQMIEMDVRLRIRGEAEVGEISFAITYQHMTRVANNITISNTGGVSIALEYRIV